MTDAVSLASDAQNQTDAANQSGLYDSRKDAVDDAARRVGTEMCTYEGEYNRVRPQGSSEGSIYTDSTIDVHPESRGPGVLDKLPGWGSDDPPGSTLKVIRASRSEIDTYRLFEATRSGLAVISWNAGKTVQVQDLTLTIPIQEGVTTLLKATAWVEVAGQSTTTALDCRIIIGNDNQIVGDGTDRLAGAGAIGKTVSVGNSDQWHGPYLKHARQMIGTQADMDVGVPVYVEIRSYSGGSGGAPPQTPAKFKTGDTYRFNTDGVNVRSSPSTGASINAVAAINTTGTIVGGPTKASGYTWWSISNPSGWVAEQFISNTTPPPPPTEPLTNRIRGGWIEVLRQPL